MLVNALNEFARIRRRVYSRLLRHFGGFAKFEAASADPGVRFDNPQGMHIGQGALLLRGTWLYCIPTSGASPQLNIGANVYVGFRSHITCSRLVDIGPGCFLSNNVLITDTMHGYDDLGVYPLRQPLIVSRVRIGEGTMIGENACIFGCVRIGRHCVVGANSVVSNCEVPDYCVVVGAPAKIVRRYDAQHGEWRKVVPPEPLRKLRTDELTSTL